MPASAPHVRSGKLKALATSTAQRLPAFADVPTAEEAGLAGYQVTTWYGIFAPAGTPGAIVNRLHADTVKAMQTPETLARMQELQVRLERLPYVKKVVSLADYVKRVNRELNGGEPAAAVVPAGSEAIAQELFVFGLSDEGRRELGRIVASDLSRAQMSVKLASMSSDLVFEQINAAEGLAAAAFAGTSIRPTVTGSGRLFATLDHYLVVSQISSFATAFVTVFGVIFIVFRSARFGFLGIIANALPVCAVLGLMGWPGISLNVATIMLASVERFCTMVARKVSTSYATKPAHASSRARQLVSMMISICLRLIEARRGAFAGLHAGRRVEHDPGHEHALREVDPHVRHGRPRGHVPVDQPDVVAGDVGTHLGELGAPPEQRRAVVAGEQAVDATGDRQLERLEQRVRNRPGAGPGGCRLGAECAKGGRHAAAGLPSSRRGCGTAAITASSTSSAERSSASAWYVSTRRWRNASLTSERRSPGIT